MEIEIGESLCLSYLKHVKKCVIYQTNWKLSSWWLQELGKKSPAENLYDKLKELGYEGKEVVLGIRPENISNDPLVLETYSHAKITSKVIVAELLGSEYIVHTDLNGENIKAIVHSRQNIKMGDELTFALDMNRAHYFDVDTELSILE